MLLVSLQVMGGSAEGAVPFWSGPRHWGQFSSAAALHAMFAVANKMEAVKAVK
jgi:hypothetical protein